MSRSRGFWSAAIAALFAFAVTQAQQLAGVVFVMKGGFVHKDSRPQPATTTAR